MRNLSQHLLNSTRTGEGFRSRAYQDTKGIWTIGYGTNLQELVISRATAEAWMEEKLVAAALSAANFSWWADLSEPRRDVVIEMIYNLGATRFRGFVKMLAALVRKDYAAAAVEMLDSKWHNLDVGKPGIQGDTDRAERLARQMREGIYV